MLRKIIPALIMLVMVGVLSCDNEPVKPLKKEKAAVAPPPIPVTINLHGRNLGVTAVDVYYYTTSSSGWSYLCTISGSNCDSIHGSFGAGSGDTVGIAVVDTGTMTGRTFKARLAAGCPSSGDNYCGNPNDGGGFTFVASASMDIAIQASSVNCYF